MSQDPYVAIVNRLYPGATLLGSERLSGGVSADVLRLDAGLPDGRTRSVVLRVHGSTHHGHAALLEYQLLEALHRRGLPVPEPLLVEESGGLLPEPFLVIAMAEGSSEIPADAQWARIDAMAGLLAGIHSVPTEDLPPLPERPNPLPELFDYLPGGAQWQRLRAHLEALTDTAYTGSPRLLHGDFWPNNLLWQAGTIAAILDWEDSALGDPLSDVACCQLELRYKFGRLGMQRFLDTYASHATVNPERLALWQVYVAAAAQRFMGQWGLEPALVDHMRREALTTIREAGAVLMGRDT
jgi:aminoglycoside phosphotransferase (APT) family kinase protein